MAAPVSFSRWFGILFREDQPTSSPWWLFPVPLRLLDQLLQVCVDRLLAGARPADPLVSDYALVIENVVRRRAGHAPLGVNAAGVHERPPGQVLLVHHGLEFLRRVVVVDADQREGF